MKYIKHIPSMALMSFIYWLAFSKDITLFVWLSWIYLGLVFFGLFLEESHRFMKDYGVGEFLIGLPFAIFNYYILWNFDESRVYLIAQIIMTLLVYAVMFNCKANKYES